jgi:hypothetical protein
VIGQAFAADALAAAGFIGAIAEAEILLFAAFVHRLLLWGGRLRIKDRRALTKTQGRGFVFALGIVYTA